MKVARLSPYEALDLMTAALGFTGPMELNHFLAALIRDELFYRGPSDPVYVTRLTHAVQARFVALQKVFPDVGESSSDALDTHMDDVLHRLDMMGDVARIGAGYWLAAPLRLIEIPESGEAVVIGGASCRVIEHWLGTAISNHGYLRTVRVADLSKEILMDTSRWQSLESWMGFPPLDLAEWIHERLAVVGARARTGLVDDFEVYVPSGQDAHIRRWRRHSDLSARDIGPSPLTTLCRTVASTSRRYWMARVDRRGSEGELPIAGEDVRRVQFGLDLIHDAPVRIVRRDDIVRLRSPVPVPEERLLRLLGWWISRPQEFPQLIQVRPQFWPVIQEWLRRLGCRIEVEGEQDGG